MIIEMTESAVLVDLLEELEQVFNERPAEEMSEQEYERQAIHFAEKLCEVVGNLAVAANDEVFTSPAFKESKSETVLWSKISPTVAEVIFSPVSPFEDLALKVSLYRGWGLALLM